MSFVAADPKCPEAVPLHVLVVAIAAYNHLRIFNSWKAGFNMANRGVADTDGEVTLSAEPFNNAH